MSSTSISNRPLSEIAVALRSKQVTAEALLEASIEGHEALGEKLNAYKLWNPEGARIMAKAADAAFAAGQDLGPLQGIPVSVKDLFGVAGLPIFAGSARQLPAKWEQEGPVIRNLKRQLAVITGKTHTVEFAAGGAGTNVHWGTPRNPWDAAKPRCPGGSSSGAGVSLWEGSALVALGTDTLGSVRNPASMNGVVGIKTTAGRWSSEGIVPLSRGYDTPGPLTRSVSDAVYAFTALDPVHARVPRPRDPDSLIIGIADDFFWRDCSPGVAEVVRTALGELVAKGARTKPAPMPEATVLWDIQAKGGLAIPDLSAFLDAELPAWRELLDPEIRWRLDQVRELPAGEYLDRLHRIEALRVTAPDRFKSVDVIVSPTVLYTPPTLDEIAEMLASDGPPFSVIHNTCPANMFGLCALSIPVGLDAARMPVGLQLMAPGGQEERLLAVAMSVEAVIGTPGDRLGMPPLLR